MDTPTKRFQLKSFKADEEKGQVTAVFATLNAIDHDGDRILNGAIGNQTVVLSAYGHASWHGQLPVGKGRVFEDGDDAVFEGQFFLDTDNGKQHFLTVKNVGELQEWSFALPDMDWQMVEEDGQHIREIKRVVIPEVSPVLMGAGINTRTLAVKGDTPLPRGYGESVPGKPEQKRFLDHVEEAVETAEQVASRAAKVHELREDKGKGPLTAASQRRLTVLRDALKATAATIDTMLVDHNLEAREIAASFEE